jgi:hypothetical protein
MDVRSCRGGWLLCLRGSDGAATAGPNLQYLKVARPDNNSITTFLAFHCHQSLYGKYRLLNSSMAQHKFNTDLKF